MSRSIAVPLGGPRQLVYDGLGRAGAIARNGFATGWQHPRGRIALIALLAALPLGGGGWVLVRKTGLSAVKHVRVSGVHGTQAAAVEAALTRAARQMSTMGVSVAKLRAAVAPLRVVSDIHVKTQFPHTLRIIVTEQLPVAVLETVGGQTAVAADGVVLGTGLLSSGLPVVHAGALPASGRVGDPKVRAELTVLGAAPAPLQSHISHAFFGQRGLTVLMRNGLRIYFGDAGRPHAKWMSAARVLADSSSAGAWYVDVRLPERPAAGIAGAASSGVAQTTGSADPSAAAIAASLAGAVSGAGGAASGGLPPADTSATSSTGAPSTTGTPGSATTTSPAGTSTGASTGAGTNQTTQSASGPTTNSTVPSNGSAGAGSTGTPAGGAAGGAAAGGGTSGVVGAAGGAVTPAPGG